MIQHSAIYVGHVRHHRRAPAHGFTIPLFMAYLDLSELDEVLSVTRLWGRSRWCPARFCREDYLDASRPSLDESVQLRVAEVLGRRPTGPVRMLTHLRYFGYVFNPVTFYYCFDGDGQLDAIVADITNTPWRERHAYVLGTDSARTRRSSPPLHRWRFDKEFHVSPFLPMDMEYDWAFTPPGPSLLAHMNLSRRGGDGRTDFVATLKMERRPISAGRLRGLLLRYPLMTAQVITGIHLQALKLWFKRATIFAHPKRPAPSPAAPPPASALPSGTHP